MGRHAPESRVRRWPQPSALAAAAKRRRAGPVVGTAKIVLGSTAAAGALLYALGYYINAAHAKMLGLPALDIRTDEIVYDALMFVPLTVFAWFKAASEEPYPGCSTLARLGWVVVLARCFGPRWWWWQRGRRGWAYRCVQRVGSTVGQTLRSVAAGVRRAGVGGIVGPGVARRAAGVLARCGRFVPLLAVLLLALLLLGGIGELLCGMDRIEERARRDKEFLHAGSAGPVEEPATWAGYPMDTLVLFREGTHLHVYGTLSLLTVVCTIGWVSLLRRGMPRWRPPPGAPRVGGLGQLVFGLCGFVLGVQWLAALALYGFLVPSNEYPAIVLPPLSQPASADPGGEELPRGEELLVLGRRRCHLVLYATHSRRLLWLHEGLVKQATRSGTGRLFPCEHDGPSP